MNLQQSAILFAINHVANNKERFLNNFYIKSKRSVAKARNEGPAAYVIPGDTPRPVEAADMVNLLRLMGVEVHTATAELSVKDQKFPAGSYVIRMDQPYSRMADMLMDTQFYNVNDPRPYDDTGWTHGRAAQRKDRARNRPGRARRADGLADERRKGARPCRGIGSHSRFRDQSQHGQHADDSPLQAQRRADARGGRGV